MSSNSKVFVGNLSYKTSKQDLASQFSSVGGVVNANIISRGNRSMGYGFVEFENDQAAQKAITVLNHQNIDGREINVELAKPREEGEQTAERGTRGRGRGGRGRGAPRGTFPSRGGSPSTGRAFRGQRGGVTSPIPRGRNPARGRSLPPRGGAIRPRGTYPPFFPRGGGGAPAFRRGGPRRAPRADRGQRDPSNTTLYVNNLPFKLEDNDLKDIFKEYDVVSAHVVANKYNGRKKGYGFVELANEDEQQKALALNGHVADGRKIGVRVAFKEVKKEEAAPQPEESKEKETKKEGKKEGEN